MLREAIVKYSIQQYSIQSADRKISPSFIRLFIGLFGNRWGDNESTIPRCCNQLFNGMFKPAKGSHSFTKCIKMFDEQFSQRGLVDGFGVARR